MNDLEGELEPELELELVSENQRDAVRDGATPPVTNTSIGSHPSPVIAPMERRAIPISARMGDALPGREAKYIRRQRTPIGGPGLLDSPMNTINSRAPMRPKGAVPALNNHMGEAHENEREQAMMALAKHEAFRRRCGTPSPLASTTTSRCDSPVTVPAS